MLSRISEERVKLEMITLELKSEKICRIGSFRVVQNSVK